MATQVKVQTKSLEEFSLSIQMDRYTPVQLRSIAVAAEMAEHKGTAIRFAS